MVIHQEGRGRDPPIFRIFFCRMNVDFFYMILTNLINFLKLAGLPKRAWQGHNTSVGREDLLV